MTRARIRFPRFVLFAATLILCACSRDEDKGGTEIRGTPVSTVMAVSMDVPVLLEAMGRLESRVAPEVAAEIDGRITQLSVDAGDSVEAGAVLAELDRTAPRLERDAAKAELARAETMLANAARRLERIRSLREKGFVSRERLDDAEAEHAVLEAAREAARSRLAIAEDQFARTVVRAPVAAAIEQRLVSVGDFVKRGTPLYRFATASRLRASLPFPESAATRLRAGLAVTLESPLATEQPVQGAIAELRPAVGEVNRAVWAIVDFENPGGWRPEATVRGEITVDLHREAVVVPTRCLVRRPAGDVIYVIEQNIAKQRVVKTGEHVDSQVEIVEGLRAGETVALEGAAYLSDGAPVRVTGEPK